MYAFSLLLSTATVLVKNGDFTAREIAALNRFSQRMSFDIDWYPGIPAAGVSLDDMLKGYQQAYGTGVTSAQEAAAADAGPALRPADLYRGIMGALESGQDANLYARYIFDIRPATDDRPYYSGYLKPRTVPQMLSRAGEFPEEWGYLLLLGTLLQAIIFGAVVILLPLLTRPRQLLTAGGRVGRILAYFACLGLGYMLAEISLIQRFVFYLADPAYANTIIITVLLVASGTGSLLAGRRHARPRVVVLAAVGGIVVYSAFFLFGLSPLLRTTLGLPLALRAAMTRRPGSSARVVPGHSVPHGPFAAVWARRGARPVGLGRERGLVRVRCSACEGDFDVGGIYGGRLGGGGALRGGGGAVRGDGDGAVRGQGSGEGRPPEADGGDTQSGPIARSDSRTPGGCVVCFDPLSVFTRPGRCSPSPDYRGTSGRCGGGRHRIRETGSSRAHVSASNSRWRSADRVQAGRRQSA